MEVLLKKNFFETSNYLMNDYYVQTSIDTEVIVRNVAKEIKHNQDYLVFLIKRRQVDNKFPQVKPIIYWAQNTDDLLIMVKLHEGMDFNECKQSFERVVTIEDTSIRVSAYCMEDEDNIRIFDTQLVELKKPIIAEKSSFEWRSDGKVVLNLRKVGAPNFLKYLMKDSVKEAKELQVWWEQRDKYIEQLEEYMMEENIKERSEKAMQEEL